MSDAQIFSRGFRASLTCGALTLLSAVAQAQSALPAYNVNPASASISGISSGGYMAAQVGIAYSSTFQAGFGVFAAGPFDCARQQTFSTCMQNHTPEIDAPNANLKSWNGTANLDNLSNLASRKIYMWGGAADTTVGPNVMNQLHTQLAAYVNPANVTYITADGAAHTFPTNVSDPAKNACNTAESPYISDCGYDGAGAVLQWMYGKLSAPNTGALSASVTTFDQTKFVAAGNGMDSVGYLYVPASCAGGQNVCKVHVALHGCRQGHAFINTDFIDKAGYNRWADSNNIIVLYPQAVPDQTWHQTAGNGSLPNPRGCWDWIGWYGSDFDQKSGVQVKAIAAMVEQITSAYKGAGGATSPKTASK